MTEVSCIYFKFLPQKKRDLYILPLKAWYLVYFVMIAHYRLKDQRMELVIFSFKLCSLNKTLSPVCQRLLKHTLTDVSVKSCRKLHLRAMKWAGQNRRGCLSTPLAKHKAPLFPVKLKLQFVVGNVGSQRIQLAGTLEGCSPLTGTWNECLLLFLTVLPQLH